MLDDVEPLVRRPTACPRYDWCEQGGEEDGCSSRRTRPRLQIRPDGRSTGQSPRPVGTADRNVRRCPECPTADAAARAHLMAERTAGYMTVRRGHALSVGAGQLTIAGFAVAGLVAAAPAVADPEPAPPGPGIAAPGQAVVEPAQGPVPPPAPPPMGAPPVPEMVNPAYGSGQSGSGPLGSLRDLWHQARDPGGMQLAPTGVVAPPPGAGAPPPLPPGYVSINAPGSETPVTEDPGANAGGPPLPPGYHSLDGPPPPGYEYNSSAPAPAAPPAP